MLQPVAVALACHLTSRPRNLESERPKLPSNPWIPNTPPCPKYLGRARNGQHKRNGPGTQRSDYEFHRVDRLQAVHATGGANESHDLASQVGGPAIGEQVKPIDGVLEGSADRT